MMCLMKMGIASWLPPETLASESLERKGPRMRKFQVQVIIYK